MENRLEWPPATVAKVMFNEQVHSIRYTDKIVILVKKREKKRRRRGRTGVRSYKCQPKVNI